MAEESLEDLSGAEPQTSADRLSGTGLQRNVRLLALASFFQDLGLSLIHI